MTPTFAAFCMLAAGACSKADFSSPVAADAGADAPVSDATTADAGTTDAPSDVETFDASHGNIGAIFCDDNPPLTCNAPTLVCCYEYAITSNYCSSTGTCRTSSSIPVECSDDSNCATGTVCCGITQSSQFSAIRCLSTCDVGNIRICSLARTTCPAGTSLMACVPMIFGG